MPASRFAAWAGASTKARVTEVTWVTNGADSSISAAFEAAAEVTRPIAPRVTGVTTLRAGVTEVTQVTPNTECGRPRNCHFNQCGNTGNLGNPKADQRVEAVDTALKAEWWRDQYQERSSIREFVGGHPRAEAEALAWSELENRWNLTHGERVPPEICAGCRRPIGTAETLDLIDGNRVHLDDEYDCLIQHGERWRKAATRALMVMGLLPPPGVQADSLGLSSGARE